MNQIGVSTGCFYKCVQDELSDKMLNILLSNSIEVIELNVIKSDKVIKIHKLSKELLSRFSYVSLHAPSDAIYRDDLNTHNLLNEIRSFNEYFTLQNIVIHPDVIENFKIFKKYEELEISLENMDNEKFAYNNIDDFDIELMNSFSLTLDLQHIFTMDQAMKTLKDYKTKFSQYIKQIHISGYHPIHKHVGLFKTNQQQIVKNYYKYSLNTYPTIIESVFEKVSDFISEIEFIKSYSSDPESPESKSAAESLSDPDESSS